MRRPFKMKGYSYPGKSPIKEQGDPSAGDQSQYQDQPEETITSTDIPDEQSGSDDSSGSENGYWKGMAEEAGVALVKAGIQTGATALSGALANKKKKSGRKGPDASGFSNIKFGRNS